MRDPPFITRGDILLAQRTPARLGRRSGRGAGILLYVSIVVFFEHGHQAPRTLFVARGLALVQLVLSIPTDSHHLRAELALNEHRAFFPQVHVVLLFGQEVLIYQPTETALLRARSPFVLLLGRLAPLCSVVCLLFTHFLVLGHLQVVIEPVQEVVFDVLPNVCVRLLLTAEQRLYRVDPHQLERLEDQIAGCLSHFVVSAVKTLRSELDAVI